MSSRTFQVQQSLPADRPKLTPAAQIFTPNEVYRELLRACSGEPFIVDTEKGSIYVGSNIGLGWDCAVMSNLGPVPKNGPAKVQPAVKTTARRREEYIGEESETEWDGLGQTPTPRDPPLGRRYAQPRPRLPDRPGRSIRDLASFYFSPAEPPVATPAPQAPLQPVGEVSLKDEGMETKEPNEGGNLLAGHQATEGKTVAETKDTSGSSSLHSGGATNGGDQGGKEAAPEEEVSPRGADEWCPGWYLEVDSSRELGPL